MTSKKTTCQLPVSAQSARPKQLTYAHLLQALKQKKQHRMQPQCLCHCPQTPRSPDKTLETSPTRCAATPRRCKPSSGNSSHLPGNSTGRPVLSSPACWKQIVERSSRFPNTALPVISPQQPRLKPRGPLISLLNLHDRRTPRRKRPPTNDRRTSQLFALHYAEEQPSSHLFDRLKLSPYHNG